MPHQEINHSIGANICSAFPVSITSSCIFRDKCVHRYLGYLSTGSVRIEIASVGSPWQPKIAKWALGYPHAVPKCAALILRKAIAARTLFNAVGAWYTGAS